MSRAIPARQKLGGTIRLNPANPQKVTNARRDLAAAKIADFVERTVATAPPLTDEQRSLIIALLRSGGRPDAP